VDAVDDDVLLGKISKVMPKRDLYFRTPLMNAAGMLGFTPDFREFQKPGFSEKPGFWDELGAFVTNPLSTRPRKPTNHPAAVEFPGGFLLHTGLPNPGLAAAIKKYAHKWADASLPIIIHVMADRPEATARMVASLENVDNVMAAELGFQNPGFSEKPGFWEANILTTLEMSLGELPLIVSLPIEQAVTLGPRVMEAGAAAVSLAAPRGTLNTENGTLVTGRLYGPSLFPQSLETVRRLAGAGVPVIGGGGVYKQEQAEAMKDAGAIAVQLDAVLWRGGF
jgi:dihydroorotate dehydrogenase (NAD+) catalytic subunit